VVVEALLKSHRSLSLAESLTCGLTGSLLSEVAGASGCLKGGWMTYTDEMKRDCLGVPEVLLQQHGAVSEQVARAMAEGARQRAGSDYALALTGFAGPTGGTDEHPVGTCFVALAGEQGTQVRRHRLVGDREMVRLRAAQSALFLLHRELAGGDSGPMA
jgi:PncC family amidohydrolase